MDVNENKTIGSLQIATDVLGKIAKQAALEIDGVASIDIGAGMVKGVIGKMQKPVLVTMVDGVAEITINVLVNYGIKIPALCERVQESIKASVQNMTGVTVSRVNVIVAGIRPETEA